VREALRVLIEHEGNPVRNYASSREFLDTTDLKSSGCHIVGWRMPDRRRDHVF
jgi:FixJ family two-component response regulator